MTAPGFPRWVGTAAWTLGKPGVHGSASLVTAPGVVAEAVRCEHRHRGTRQARECGRRMADRRNARLRP